MRARLACTTPGCSASSLLVLLLALVRRCQGVGVAWVRSIMSCMCAGPLQCSVPDMSRGLVCVPAASLVTRRAGAGAVCVAPSLTRRTFEGRGRLACCSTAACSPARAASTRPQTCSTPSRRLVMRSIASLQELMRAIWSSSFAAVADAPPAARPCRPQALPVERPRRGGVAVRRWELAPGSCVDIAWLSEARNTPGGDCAYMDPGAARQFRAGAGACWPGRGCDKNDGCSCVQHGAALANALFKQGVTTAFDVRKWFSLVLVRDFVQYIVYTWHTAHLKLFLC